MSQLGGTMSGRMAELSIASEALSTLSVLSKEPSSLFQADFQNCTQYLSLESWKQPF